MQIRDEIKDGAYWEEFFDDNGNQINRMYAILDKIKKEKSDIDTTSQRGMAASYSIHKLVALYSSGKSTHDIKEYIENLIIKYQDTFGWEIIGAYEEMIWMVSIGILVRIDQKYLEVLSELINKDGTPDYMLYFLLDRAGVAQKYSEDTPLFIKVGYPNLKKVVLAGDKQSAQIDMKSYLSRWYQSIRGRAWWGNHKADHVPLYFGYWSFESAAVTALLDLDDSSYRDSTYYPSDLVDYYRENS